MVNWNFYTKDNSQEKLKWWMYIAIILSFLLGLFIFCYYVDHHIISPIQDWKNKREQEYKQEWKEKFKHHYPEERDNGPSRICI